HSHRRPGGRQGEDDRTRRPGPRWAPGGAAGPQSRGVPRVTARGLFYARPLGGSRPTGSAGQQGRRVRPDAPTSCAVPRTVYGKLTNRSRKSEAVAASRSIGVMPKISWTVRSVELWS